MREPTDPPAAPSEHATPGPSTPGPSRPGPSRPGPSTPGPSTPGPPTPPRPSFSALARAIGDEPADTPPRPVQVVAGPDGPHTRDERAAWRALPLEPTAVDGLVDAALGLQGPADDAARAAGLATLRAEIQALIAEADEAAAGHASQLEAFDARLATTLERTELLAAAGLDAAPALRARLEATRLVLRAVRAALARPERR
jgi:hypothetical protein